MTTCGTCRFFTRRRSWRNLWGIEQWLTPTRGFCLLHKWRDWESDPPCRDWAKVETVTLTTKEAHNGSKSQ